MPTRRQRVRRGVVVLSFLALPITLNYYSPYLMVSGTLERVATFSLVLWVTVLLSSTVLGRSFCGWACPFNGLQQAWESVCVRPLRRVRYLPVVKYVLWASWVAAVFSIALVSGGWERFAPLYLTETGVSVTDPGNLLTYFLLVAVTLAPAGLGRRGFCRNLCPFGVWTIVGERIGKVMRLPRLRLSADAGRCTACGSCTRACPMQLPVPQMVAAEAMRTTECVMCGSCVDVCPAGAVVLGFGPSGDTYLER